MNMEAIMMDSGGRIGMLFRMLIALVLVGAVCFPLRAQAQVAHPGYVVLGDSIDFGVGSSEGGYVIPFRDYLADPSRFGSAIDVHNFSQPTGVECRDVAHNELPPSIVEIQTHRPSGVVVSLGCGGNDLRHFIQSPQAATCLQDVSCLARINALLNEIEQTVDLMLKTLRFFAGPESAILVRTQYNPLLVPRCDLQGRAALGEAALEGGVGLLQRGLNDRLRDLAKEHGAKVAELHQPFAERAQMGIDDFVEPPGQECIHPNDAGYAVIVDAFIKGFNSPDP